MMNQVQRREKSEIRMNGNRQKAAVSLKTRSQCSWFYNAITPNLRDAVFIVSPKSWNLALSPRRTPAVTGPLWRPTRRPRSAVPGPSESSNSFERSLNLCKHFCANLHMIRAWSGCGSGRPATATSELVMEGLKKWRKKKRMRKINAISK